MKGIIYCATSPSGKKYYGFALDLKIRQTKHKSSMKSGYSNKFYNAIRKYGWDNIRWEIIEEHSADSKKRLNEILCERETHWIEKDNTFESGYNMTRGGDGVLGLKWNEGSREKLSETQKGRKLSEAHKRNIGKANRGRKLSKESKAKIGRKNRGNKYCLGVERSPETREKIAESKVGENNPMYGKTPWNKGLTKKKK